MSKKKPLFNAWRICWNKNARDWNDEPERHIVRYDVYDEKGNNYIVSTSGFKKQLHALPKCQFFATKEDCVACIESGARMKGGE